MKDSLAGVEPGGSGRPADREGGAGTSSMLFEVGDSMGLEIVIPPLSWVKLPPVDNFLSWAGPVGVTGEDLDGTSFLEIVVLSEGALRESSRFGRSTFCVEL